MSLQFSVKMLNKKKTKDSKGYSSNYVSESALQTLFYIHLWFCVRTTIFFYVLFYNPDLM